MLPCEYKWFARWHRPGHLRTLQPAGLSCPSDTEMLFTHTPSQDARKEHPGRTASPTLLSSPRSCPWEDGSNSSAMLTVTRPSLHVG